MALNLSAFDAKKKTPSTPAPNLNLNAFTKGKQPQETTPLTPPKETADAPLNFGALKMQQTFGDKSIQDYPTNAPVDLNNISGIIKEPDRSFLPNTEVSAGRPTIAQKLVQKLPEPVRATIEPIIQDISEGLFGSPMAKETLRRMDESGDVSIAEDMANTGVVGFLAPFLSRTNTDKVEHISKKLEESGVPPERASAIAFYDVFKTGNPTDASVQTAQKRLEALQITPQEKNVLTLAHVGQFAGSVGDVANVLPVGFIKAAARPGIMEALLGASKPEIAANILRDAKVPEDLIKTYAPKFAATKDAAGIERGLNSLERVIQTTRPEVAGAAKAEKPALKVEPVLPGKTEAPKTIGLDGAKPDAAKIASRYYDEVIKPTMDQKKTVVVAGDDMKKFVGGDYAPENSDEYAKASFKTIKDLAQHPDVKSIVILGGGPGAGKTEFLGKNIVQRNLADVVYDTTFTNEKGIKQIVDLARANGKEIEIQALLPNLETARYHTVKRAAETGRDVPDEVFANRHTAFPKTLRKLLEDGTLKADEVVLYDLRDVKNPDEIRKIIKDRVSEADPLATLENIRYDESHVRQTYKAERFSSQFARPDVNAGSGGGSRGLSTGKQSIRAEGISGEGISGGRSINDLKTLIKERFPNLTESSRQDFAEMISGMKNENSVQSVIRQMDALNEKMHAANPAAMGADKSAINQERSQLSFYKEGLQEMPGKSLQKYASRATGDLPEVTGKKTMRSISGSGKTVKTGEFGRRGDQIASEKGFESVDEANAAFDRYKRAKEDYKLQQDAVRSKVKAYRDRKAVFDQVVQYVKQEGINRREKIAAVQDFFKLDDADMSALMKNERDIRLMSDTEFESFMKKIEGRATELHFKREAMIELQSTIFEKDLKKIENLRKALSMPDIKNMSIAQIKKFNEALQEFKHGDEFLGVRQLQTVKHTDLAGIKTRREALERLAAQVNKEREAAGKAPVSVEDLNKIHVSELDRYRYDTALARQNPLYEIMVQEKNRAFLNADAQLMDDQEMVDKYFKAARESRTRGMLDRLIPSDNLIFNWLEANDADKLSIAQDMTDKELEAGMYIQSSYREMRDYLLQQKVLKKYITDYVTHTRRGFLEAWKEGGTYVAGDISGEKPGPVKRATSGLVAAFKEVMQKYVQDEAYFNILNQKTDQVLPLEKFFQYSMKRTGELVPSKNVAKAFVQYRQTFLKKQALDSIIPKLDIYVHSLTPQKMTPRGLEFDTSLKSFFKEWMNSKKGRVTDRALVKPGGKVDFALRTGIALTRLLDLGLSVPVGIASNMGAHAAAFRGLGTKNFVMGETRMFTKQGQNILKKYRNFTGEPVTRKMFSSEGTLGDSLMSGVFSLFSFADRKARQAYLLGKMTPEEFKTGEISSEKLARLQTELGRHMPIPGSESIIGKTALGKVATQYKTWAIPLLSSTLDDIAKASRAIKNMDPEFLKSPEFGELVRTIALSSVVGTATYGIVTDKTPQKDMSFTEVVAQKAAQDALSLVGALNPTLWTSPTRLQAFLLDLSDSINKIVTLEEKKDGTLTGPAKLQRTIVPAAVRQLMSGIENAGGSDNGDVSVADIQIPDIKVPEINIPDLKI